MVSRYVSKFMTDFLPTAAATVIPSVFATVIGAWIVTHYINPKDSGDQSKAKTEASAPVAKAPLNGASGMTPRPVENVAVKPIAVEQPEAKRNVREKAATEKAVTPSKETNKEAKATPQSVVTPVQRTEERRDATDLARAALERLRQDAPEAVRPSPVPVIATPAASAPVAPAPIPTAPAVAATPAPVAIPLAPALPPPVVITAPRDIQPAFEASSRPTPPADIPANGDGLATGSAMSERASDNPSLFGGLKSAAKSLVDTVVPR